jgi:hypothetical protein
MTVMPPTRFAAVFLLVLPAIAAEMPLPELRIEPTGGGSIFYIKNTSALPLAAYLIELVGYPGSSYSFWQDETVADAIPPNAEKRMQVSNMTVGAVPDYVKMQAAVYAGGASAGIAEKIVQLRERRRAMLDTVRELIGRIEKAQSEKTAKSDLIAALKQSADAMQSSGKGNRNSQAAINQAASRDVILVTNVRIGMQSPADALIALRTWERALSANTQSQ